MAEFVIGHIGDLIAWIRANLPDLDEDRFHPWTTGQVAPGAVTARIEIRVHGPGHPVRRIDVDLSAEPIHQPASDTPGVAHGRTAQPVDSDSR
ncbi:hypothetical protein ACIHDR_41615 [Nocardia sp. NPDC052278]|uniref:hypothetical protein n=1 Tax=unclassified Nocardia TaxID=2637762 RepID=UPI0036A6E46C